RLLFSRLVKNSLDWIMSGPLMLRNTSTHLDHGSAFSLQRQMAPTLWTSISFRMALVTPSESTKAFSEPPTADAPGHRSRFPSLLSQISIPLTLPSMVSIHSTRPPRSSLAGMALFTMWLQLVAVFVESDYRNKSGLRASRFPRRIRALSSVILGRSFKALTVVSTGGRLIRIIR